MSDRTRRHDVAMSAMADLDGPTNAHLAPAAIANCPRCDDEGYRLPARRVVCDHRSHENVGRAQRDHIRKMLAKKGGES